MNVIGISIVGIAQCRSARANPLDGSRSRRRYRNTQDDHRHAAACPSRATVVRRRPACVRDRSEDAASGTPRTTRPPQSPYTPLVLMYTRRCGMLRAFRKARIKLPVLASRTPALGGGAKCSKSCGRPQSRTRLCGSSRSPDNGVTPSSRSSSAARANESVHITCTARASKATSADRRRRNRRSGVFSSRLF